METTDLSTEALALKFIALIFIAFIGFKWEELI